MTFNAFDLGVLNSQVTYKFLRNARIKRDSLPFRGTAAKHQTRKYCLSVTNEPCFDTIPGLKYTAVLLKIVAFAASELAAFHRPRNRERAGA